MTNPGEAIDAQATIRITAMTADFTAMLRVVEAFGLGDLSVSELLEQVETLAAELGEQAGE